MKYPVNFEIEFKKNNYPGKFIVIEGIEASGKSTQTEVLMHALQKDHKVFRTKNPTDSFVGDLIRNSILVGRVRIPPVSLQYLFAADREIQQQEIIERLRKGEIVISDRYFWSSVAYGAADVTTDYDNFINLTLTSFSLLSMYHEFIVPDITFFLEVNIEEAEKRLSKSQKHKEIYDNWEMNIKVKKGYDWLIKKFPEHFTVVSGNRSVDQVSQEILGKVNKVFNAKR